MEILNQNNNFENSENETAQKFDRIKIGKQINKFKNKKNIEIRKVFFKNREIKMHIAFFTFSFLYIFIMFYFMYDSIYIFLFTILFLSIYGYILVKHRWFLNKGFLKYKNEKMTFNYNNEFDEINYSDILKVEKEKSFFSGISFFIYSKEDKKVKIKFNFYNYDDVTIFEDKLKNKNILINNL